MKAVHLCEDGGEQGLLLVRRARGKGKMPVDSGGGDEFCGSGNLRRLQRADNGYDAVISQEFGGCATGLFRVGGRVKRERQDFDIGRLMVCQGGAHSGQGFIAALAVQPFEGRQEADLHDGAVGGAGRKKQEEDQAGAGSGNFSRSGYAGTAG